MTRIAHRPRLTGTNVALGSIIVLLLGSGTAYAANEWTGDNIVDGSLTTADILDNSLRSGDILNSSLRGQDVLDGSITNADILDNDLTTFDILDNSLRSGDITNNNLRGVDILDGSLTGADILDDSVGPDDVSQLNGDSDIQDNTITTFDIATNAVDSDEVLDFGLSNEDVGVLFAQVNADGSIFNSSGGVTGASLGTGTYEVNFGRDISNCGFFGTQGEGGIGGAGGAIIGVTDRSGNANAVFATARDASGALVNTAIQLMVVC